MEGFGQDIHLSQFLASPLNLNPALAGDFDGDYRLVGNQRRQWASVTVPFQTFGLSADARDPLQIPGLGAGISMYNDVAGDSEFGTLQFNVAGSYRKAITSDSAHWISLGVQTGITRRKINYSDLSFDNQYNGTRFDPTLPDGENFSRERRTYPNLNAGLVWAFKIAPRKSVKAGAGLFNINQPKQSFFDNNEITLDRRWVLHAEADYYLAADWDLIPALLYQRQGPHSELNLGGSVRYTLDPSPLHYRAIYGGLWTRAADAGFVSVGMDYDQWKVGVSYDLNYSQLTTASNGRGGLEVSVIYIFKTLKIKRAQFRNCPDYI